MANYLYEVRLKQGRSNPKHSKFLVNVSQFNAKSPDYSGISNVCVIGHHMDIITIESLCAEGLGKNKSDVTVKEITKETLGSTSSGHRLFTDLIERYFLPYNEYQNIK